MKTPSARIQFAGVLFTLALAQWACGSAASPATENPQTAPTLAQPAAPSSDRGTPAEAQALLKLAIDHYNQVGADQAHKDFDSNQSPWIDRDLYVVCLGADHKETANGGFPQYVGVSPDTLASVGGVPLGQATWDAAASGGVGTVDYQWLNPVSGQTEPKRLFVEKVGIEVCGVGAYNP